MCIQWLSATKTLPVGSRIVARTRRTLSGGLDPVLTLLDVGLDVCVSGLEVDEAADARLLAVCYGEHARLFCLLAVSCAIDHYIIHNLVVRVTVDEDRTNDVAVEAETL